MRYLIRADSSDANWDGDAPYMVIEITPAYARKLIARMETVRHLKEHDADVWGVEYLDYNPRFIDRFPALTEWLHGGLIGLYQNETELDDLETVTIPDDLAIPEEAVARVDFPVARVTDEAVYYEAILKHSTITLSSAGLYKSDLEEVAAGE